MYSPYMTQQYSFQEEYLRLYGVMPREVTFIVTEACNLCCTYCYQHNKSARVMDFETAKRCVDVLFEEDARNSKYINPHDAHGLILDFIGGEPLLEIDLIDRIVDYFLARALELKHRWATQYMISMSTNGTLYFENNVQRFVKKHEGRVSIGVTIDGDRELHDMCRRYPDGRGSYDDAAAAFDELLRRHGQTGTKLTLAPANIGYLAGAARNMFERFGIRDLHANCVYEEGWDYSHARVLYEQLCSLSDWLLDNDLEARHRISLFNFDRFRPLPPERNENWCGGTGKMLAFGVDGVIYPCLRYAPASLGPGVKPLVVGDAAHGIERTAEEKATCEMLRRITRASQSTEECMACPIADGCAWCSAYCYERNGTPDKRTTYTCCMHKATALANAYHWNRLMRKHGSCDRFTVNVPREWALDIISADEYDELVRLSAKPESHKEVQ